MRSKDIKEGETYLFVATTSETRKHLEGTQFTVYEKRLVFRRLQKGRKKVYRYFNEDGIGARPEELEPLPDAPQCHICGSDTPHSCTHCGQPVCDIHTSRRMDRVRECTECHGGDLPF